MLTAGGIVEGAFRLVRTRPGAVLVWSLLYTVGATGLSLGIQRFVNAQAMAAAGGDPNRAAAAMVSFMGPFLLMELALFLLIVTLMNAAQRAVLRPDASAFAYLRFGMDEVRVIGLFVVLIVAFYVGAIAAGIVILLFAGLLGAAGGLLAGGAIGAIGFIALTCAAIWAGVRLSLAAPLTILRDRFVLGESWRLTKGRFWTLFGGYFLIWLIMLVLILVAGFMVVGSYWADLAQSGFTPEGMQQAAQRQFERQQAPDLMIVLGWALNGLIGGLGIALFGGATATATRELAVDREAIADTFA
jgi:hypothetical protein